MTLAIAIAAACAETPTAPTTVTGPTLSSGAFGLRCPQPIERFTSRPQPVTITFPDPIGSGGAVIDKVECSPASGSSFAPGLTPVTCTAQPAGQVVASCSFTVNVVSQRLGVTRFLAFGDSITRGFVPHQSVPDLDTVAVELNPLFHIPPDLGNAYPFKLNQLLSNRYQAQNISVINSGQGGEVTPDAVRRLPPLLDSIPPDVLLLLEGSNDVKFFSPTTTVANLRMMARDAQIRGIRVLIATIPPISAPQSDLDQSRGQQINDGINSLAFELGIAPAIPVAETLAGTPGGMAFDGKHPTEEGYATVAETFFREIIRRFEETSEEN